MRNMELLELIEQYEGMKGEPVKKYIYRPEIVSYQQRLGKVFADMNQHELLGMLLELKNSKTNKPLTAKNTVRRIIYEYKNFYDFLIKQGIKDTNIFNDDRLSVDTVCKLLVEDNKEVVTLYTDEEVESFVNIAIPPRNLFYYECFIRLLYEGVISDWKDSLNIVGITVNGKIVLDRGMGMTKSNASDRLVKLVKACTNTKNFNTLLYPNSIDYDVCKYDNKSFMYYLYDNNEGSTWESISKVLRISFKRREINSQRLYLSGLYKYLLTRDTKEEIDRLLWGDNVVYSSNAEARKLLGYIKDYNCPYNVSLVRMYIQKYVPY